MSYYNSETSPMLNGGKKYFKNIINIITLTERDVIALKPCLLYNVHCRSLGFDVNTDSAPSVLF